MSDTKQVKAVVFPQWTIKWQELGKAAILAGLSAGLTLLGTSIFAQHLPTTVELKQAGLVALTTALGVIIRDFTKPTTVVIKGQEAPVVNATSNTITVTDTK